jgi:alkaline phosphatase D
MHRIIKLLLIFFSFLLSSENYVLMVSFDGFRYDYTDLADTPNFDRLAKGGVRADALIPVFPSLTFPNHYSIATGAYAGTHNITGNSFYDKVLKKEYSLYKPNTVRDSSFYKAEPIWATAERQGLKAASYFWVGSEAPIKGYSPSIFKYYDGNVSFESRIDSIISWFKLPKINRPNLAMLYFSEPDQTGHNMGADNFDIIFTIEKMDKVLGYLLDQLEKLNIYKKLNIIIVSDHGMANVSKDKRIIIDDYILKYIDKVTVRGKGAYMQLDVDSFSDLSNRLLFKELQKIPYVKVWKKNDIPNRFNFINHNTGDFLILANEGWLLTTREDYQKKKFRLKGMHGYDPSLPNMHGIFYATGANIKKDLSIKAFENIHIYPLICKILEIEPYSGESDSPQGQINILENILKKENE